MKKNKVKNEDENSRSKLFTNINLILKASSIFAESLDFLEYLKSFFKLA